MTAAPLSIGGKNVDTVSFQGRELVILSCERVDTGMGLLNSSIMPLPTLLLGLFGTPAKFVLRTDMVYDPETGDCACTEEEFTTTVYPESLTVEGNADTGQEAAVITKLYVPGEVFNYQSVALLVLSCEEVGADTNPIARP